MKVPSPGAVAWRHAVLIAAAALNCTSVHEGGGTDSSTHWLRSCERHADCDELSCVCGVCTLPCTDEAACGAFGAAAECAPVQGAACAEAHNACVQPCDRDADCAGLPGASCAEGSCAREALPGTGEGGSSGPPAGSGGMATTAGTGGTAGTAGTGGTAGMTTDAGASANRCDPQQAASNGDDCAEVVGYAWNGAACKPIVCGCAGADCDAIDETRQACEAAHAPCRPESTCGAPWYKCPDQCPAELALLGGARVFGECAGDCSFVLTVRPVVAESMGGVCERLGGTLEITNTSSQLSRLVEFTLTDAAWEEAAQISLGLTPAALASAGNGCGQQQCAADGGFASVRATSPDFPLTAEYIWGAPPDPLRAADAFVQPLIDQARACTGEYLATCHTVQSDTRIEPSCGEMQPISSESCACPFAVEDFMQAHDQPCDASCGVCNLPASTCGAYCVRACSGGATTWSPWCTE